MSFNKTDSKLVQEESPDKPVSVFGLFKDLNSPFESNSYPQFSPINGIDKQLIKNLRLHGHYGQDDKKFPRPGWLRTNNSAYPQDWVAALFEFFAPSYTGFLFDTVLSTPFHHWLKPKNIALIFNTISEPTFYENPRESILKLTMCLQPEADFNKLKIDEKKRLDYPQNMLGQNLKYGAFHNVKSLSWPTKALPFAEILFEALNATKGDGAANLGYPAHIIERLLLTYMWERKKSKLDLKPFYDTLSERIIDKEAVKNIIWEKEGSFYTEVDYYKVVTRYNAKQAMTLEDQKLLQLGYSYFEDRLPPIQSYGVSVVKREPLKKNEKKLISFSDCGEISLLNYFMMALYDPITKRFDWEKLERLKKQGFKVSDKLIHFFRYIYTSPICDFTQDIRNAWAAVLSDLNANDPDCLIRYLKSACSTDPDSEKICCIAPGLDNMKQVMKKLLQPSTTYGGDIFLELLNLGEKRRIWYQDKEIADDKTITLTFKKYSEKNQTCEKLFQWHFQAIHFDLNRLEHAKYNPATQVLDELKASINKNAHKDPTSYTLSMPKLTGIENEAAFAEDLFQGNLDSIEGKCYALYKIFWFKNTFNSHSFDYLIHRWLEKSGKYFAGWEDFHTNKTLLKILMTDCNLPKEAIDELDIPALSAHMKAKIIYRDIQNSETISSDNEDIIILGSVNGKVTNSMGKIKIIGDVYQDGSINSTQDNNKDIIIFGSVNGKVTNANGKITIIGNVYEKGSVNNTQGNNEINGDVSGHIVNLSGNNKITGTVSTKGNVNNSSGTNEIGGIVTGHVANCSGDNKITRAVYGHVKNSTGTNTIGGDVLGHVENLSGDNKITGTTYKQEPLTNSPGKKACGVQQTFFSQSPRPVDISTVLQQMYDKRSVYKKL